jgi:hypothetical protein
MRAWRDHGKEQNRLSDYKPNDEDWDQTEKDEKKLETEEAESDTDEPGEYEPIAVVGKRPGASKRKKKPARRPARK